MIWKLAVMILLTSYTGTAKPWNYGDGTTAYSNEILNSGRLNIKKNHIAICKLPRK